MKTVISISLGPSRHDYEVKEKFLGEEFFIKRIGTDGDTDEVEYLLEDWENDADAIGLGGVQFPDSQILPRLTQNRATKLQELSKQLKVPVTTGERFRKVAQEWVVRYVQSKYKDFFNNSRVFFVSGLFSYSVANVLSAHTQNMSFADPIYEHGIPKFLNSIKDLELYAKGLHDVLEMSPLKSLTQSFKMISEWNKYLIRKAMQKAHVIVVPFYGFYDFLKDATAEELGGKIIITATAYDDRIEYLKEMGVSTIIDSTPQIMNRVVGYNVIEAMIMAVLGKKADEITNDDLLEIISEQEIHPRVIFPHGKPRTIRRFAFVIHPLSQEDFKKEPAAAALAGIPGFMDIAERIIAYAPPFLYGKMSGIKSPQGVEAEGWLISVGGTPKQMLSHSPEFTYRRLLQAARMAKRLGAQIMGLGAFTKVVGDAGVTVSRMAEIPITTGNSYSASGALWAAADASRRLGLIKGADKGKKIKGKSMVIGATGAIGSVCCRLLAMAFDEVIMVDVRDARLLELRESILQDSPKTKITIATRPDKFLSDMDVIVTATSAAGKTVLDIMKVKPGCVITDVARPLDLKPEDVAKRPDVLYIESGEIMLPGEPKFRSIGLPPGVVFACLAETIVLTLEGRFETFTIGREIEWQKVKDIYAMGLKHGMKLASISGPQGVYTDEDIAKIRELALNARKRLAEEADKAKKEPADKEPSEKAKEKEAPIKIESTSLEEPEKIEKKE